MATTYEKIASVTVGSGGATDIQFTSIPGTFDDLVVKISARFANSAITTGLWIQPNGLTTNQSIRFLQGNGASASSFTDTKIYFDAVGNSATASTFGNAEVYIPNYAGNTNKSFSIDAVTENNATTAYQDFVAGLWSSTAAITSLTLTVYSGGHSLQQYSTATLYGIKKS